MHSDGTTHILGKFCPSICWPGPSAEICRGFLCINFGGFWRGFSWRIFWALFPPKMMSYNPATKSAKKSGGSKAKSAKKSDTAIAHVCHSGQGGSLRLAPMVREEGTGRLDSASLGRRIQWLSHAQHVIQLSLLRISKNNLSLLLDTEWQSACLA